MNDLELVSTSDLIDELERRHEHGAIGLVCEDTSDATSFSGQSWGNPLIVVGLCQQLSQKVLNDIDIMPDDDDDDDDDEIENEFVVGF